MLKIAGLDKEFVVCKDASNRGLGGVPIQEGYIICYESRISNEHEHNYLTHDLELAMIIHALKMSRHYLLSRWFILMSDHNGSMYLFDQPNTNARKARWLAMINEFEFEIKYIKGKENMVSYALSRMIQLNHIAGMSYYGIDLQDHIL